MLVDAVNIHFYCAFHYALVWALGLESKLKFQKSFVNNKYAKMVGIYIQHVLLFSVD